MSCSVKEMLEKFDVSELAPQRFLAEPLSGGRGVVDGHQLLAQSLVAAGKTQAQKRVCSIHMLFAKTASDAEPVEIEVEPLSTGNSFTSARATVWQGERQCASGLVLLAAEVPDLIHHQARAPAVPDPEDCYSLQMPVDGREVRLVENIDLMNPDEPVGPACLHAWLRYADTPSSNLIDQAMLAHFSGHLSIATAMRAHAGVAQSLAHTELMAGILSLNVVFHQPGRSGEWRLYAHESPYAGCGLSYARAQVYNQGGQLLASFNQENMIRAMPAQRKSAKERLL